jgi:hypothetical protein
LPLPGLSENERRSVHSGFIRSGKHGTTWIQIAEVRKIRAAAMIEVPATTADDNFAARLRGFGPLGILTILIIIGGNFVIAPLSAILVLIWTKISNTPWCEIGYVRPRSWIETIVIGIIFGVAFKFVMKAAVMPLFGAPPINQAYQFVTGNPL